MPVLLDTFCKAGGCSKGYADAGFTVVGVDIEPQPNYPYDFIQADAFDFVLQYGSSYDAIHASPPCQAYSAATNEADRSKHPNLILPMRWALRRTGRPYIMENVVGAPLLYPKLLCGSMFNLRVRRHRLFETNWPLAQPWCQHRWQDEDKIWESLVSAERGKWRKTGVASVFGNGSKVRDPANPDRLETSIWREAMGIEWMLKSELSQAIPPRYTEFIGRELLEYMGLGTGC